MTVDEPNIFVSLSLINVIEWVLGKLELEGIEIIVMPPEVREE